MNPGLLANDLESVCRPGEVMYQTSIIRPGQRKVIYFEASEEAGHYKVVCPFSGHNISMLGVLKVQ